jgi:DNA polymerase-3 subunit beta
MKVTCLQENLAKGLGIVGRAVALRSTLPITSNVLIATDHGRIKLAATNLDIALSCWIGGQIEEEGAITVPSRLLSDFVNSLPSEKIDLTLSPRARQLTVKCARNEAKIGGMDADDFPPIPAIEDGATLELDPVVLREAITQVVFSAATDDSRPVLTGVGLTVDGDEVTFAASDGFRLAVRTLKLKKKAGDKHQVIVPAKALAELNRLLQDQDDPVAMTFNANMTQVLFRLKDVELVSQLIQGTFPDYSRLIPKEWTSRAIVEVRDFLQETKIASIFARDGSGIVRVMFEAGEGGSPGQMKILAKAEEIGENDGSLDASVEGEPSKVAFNGKYLQDVLSVLDGRVALETTGPSQPGVIRPLDNDNYVHVVMPMFVQW